MKGDADTLAGGVMAVLVLYGRHVEEAAAWPVLRAWLGATSSCALRYCLIYDNSPETRIDPATLPDNAALIHDPANGGTSAAYRAAAARAGAADCKWLLLLDQDTGLPPDYLASAGCTVAAAADAAVLVPRIRHDGLLVSPATITPAGSIVPTDRPGKNGGMATAISSGVIVRSAVIEKVRFPAALWLDYVDHWVFLAFAREGSSVATIDVDLAHDLSIRTPRTLSLSRVKSILAAERIFYQTLGGRARTLLPARQALRAVRYARLGRLDLAVAVLQAMIAPPRGRHQ
ncbi:hypothetical protein ACNI3Q_05315 [Sphingomonas sp. FW199]|uniref:hypothetical protein n=1 Tax=Sphingomonas sp. FW199 TaxID=3400217 RepID=UPI003CF40164